MLQSKDNPDKGTKIILLGTGTPNADPERSGPSVAIVVKGKSYIIDFGPGVVRRAVEAYLKGVLALKPSNLKIAFVTHLHSDHTAGYPDLILTPWVIGRRESLEVFGPPGIKEMTKHVLKAYHKDIDVRINGLEGLNPEGCRVNAHEIEPGVVYKDEYVIVKAFTVKHGSWDYSFGYRFETLDRVIVISGDCAPSTALIENSKGCDVLVHEVYSSAGFKGHSPDRQRYHSSSHTSSLELGRIAAEVKPGLLILYHQLLWNTRHKEFLREIRQVYKGKVVFGNDLGIY